MISMAVKTTLSYKVERVGDEMVVPPLLSMNNGGGTNMNDNDNVTFKDLKIVEGKLSSKIAVSNAKLSGKIDTSEAKLSGKIDASEASLSGKIDTLTAKIDSQSKLLYWIMGIISAGIVVPLITMLIKYLISK